MYQTLFKCFTYTRILIMFSKRPCEVVAVVIENSTYVQTLSQMPKITWRWEQGSNPSNLVLGSLL